MNVRRQIEKTGKNGFVSTISRFAQCMCLLILMHGGMAMGAELAVGQNLLLSGSDWRIHEEATGFMEADVLAMQQLEGWTPASVPGNIQADLESAHLLNPLWYGPGDPRLHEVARKNWWYCKDVVLPQEVEGKRLTLIFDGVDFECRVWVNGHSVGANKGMFRRFWFDVQEHVKPGQANRIVVWIAAMPAELYPKMVNCEGTPETHLKEPKYWFVNGMNDTRVLLKDLKAPANWSYDWGTNIYTLGIWKDVSLRITEQARIDWVRVDTTLSPDFKNATAHVQLDIDSPEAGAATAAFRIHGNGADIPLSVPVTLQAGQNHVTADIPFANPELWWPNGHGSQPIYQLESSLHAPDGGVIADARSTKFGVREIRWEQLEGAPKDFINPFQLVVNGRPIRMMGSNLTSPDLLFGRNDQHSRWYMQMAKDAGFNTLRLHGGQVIFSDVMYDAADELGIMLSQEFPIANCVPENDEEFLRNLETTSRNIARQVRNHPCIIEWTGGNEMGWLQGADIPALHVFERVIKEEDDAIFRATCPIQGGYHTPYVYKPDGYYSHFNHLNSDYFGGAPLMRYGEFGTQSPANLEVWYREIPPSSQWPIKGWEDWILCRKMVADGPLPESQYWLHKSIIDFCFGPQDGLPGLVQGGQYLGAEGLRYAMDALRRRGKTFGGFMNWDFNEPWPNGGGSFMVDYDGRPLMNFYFSKQACAPISLSLKYDSFQYEPDKGIQAELWMVSDAPEAAQNLRWRWLARDRRGTVITQNEGQASIEPVGVLHLDDLAIKPLDKTMFGPILVELSLYDQAGNLLTDRIHIFGVDRVRGPLGGLLDNRAPDQDDDPLAWSSAPLLTKPMSPKPDNQMNLAYVGNGAQPATATTEIPVGSHPAKNINDGAYGNGRSWISNLDEASFTIDLSKEYTLGLFKIGRDRASGLDDRKMDSLKIEVSLDGQNWTMAYEKTGISSIPGYSPTKTLEIQIPRVNGRFVRATVGPNEVGVDEFEAYAPLTSSDPEGELPRVTFTDPAAIERSFFTYYEELPLLSRPVKRTAFQVESEPMQTEGDTETIRLHVTNTGAMTALFCEVHPMLEYRTDLEIDNNFCSIPPGEKRTINVRASSSPAGGLHLDETGWRTSCWNADDVYTVPAPNVLLSVGRRDKMCREYAGYGNIASIKDRKEETVTAEIKYLGGEQIPFILQKSHQYLRFQFAADDAAGQAASQLRLHTADQSPDAPTSVKLTVNGTEFNVSIPKGIGVQSTEPFHLAFPYTAVVDIPAGCIKAGNNVLDVQVLNDGWFTWDAMDLLSKAGSSAKTPSATPGMQ